MAYVMRLLKIYDISKSAFPERCRRFEKEVVFKKCEAQDPEMGLCAELGFLGKMLPKISLHDLFS